jgi:hypothetical protein
VCVCARARARVCVCARAPPRVSPSHNFSTRHTQEGCGMLSSGVRKVLKTFFETFLLHMHIHQAVPLLLGINWCSI